MGDSGLLRSQGSRPKHVPLQPVGGVRIRADFLRSELLGRAWPGLRHGFYYGWPRLEDEGIVEAAAALLGLEGEPPWIFQQVHGADMLDLSNGLDHRKGNVGSGDLRSSVVAGVDGAMASFAPKAGGTAGDTLIVKAADCVSVLAVHPEGAAYAALHAGWRGAAAGILPRLLTAWRGKGAGFGKLRMAFGPHIRACCFEVRADCLSQFEDSDLQDAVAERDGRMYLNLEQVLRTQAARFGIAAEQIDALPQCTQCHMDSAGSFDFASYRRAQRDGRAAGRNISFIGPVR